MMKQIVQLFICIFLSVPLSLADKHEMPEIKVSPQFERMKQLVGDWKGTSVDMPEGQIEVQYRLSSGGTAIVETISPGTSHEMTTIYFDEGGKLAMTHYCMLGNHPTMHLTEEKKDILAFKVAPKSSLKNDKHMNSLTIRLDGENAMEQLWTMSEGGKKQHETIFKLERVSEDS